MNRELDQKLLLRLAEALERLAPAPPTPADLGKHEAFVWRSQPPGLDAVVQVNRVDLSLLKGIDLTREQLLENTRRFAKGLPANNALLWGARGMGKSSLVKAAQAVVNRECDGTLKIVEIHREDINSLPQLSALLRATPQFRFIVFCDDLSFDGQDTSYKSVER